MKKNSIDTKTKIKNSALELFNKQDTLSITTNHIAKKTNISIGNLYYYFKNKEEIILSIYKDLSKEFEAIKGFKKLKEDENPIKSFHMVFEFYSDLFFKYRFLLRDSMVLIALYPSIKKLFLINQEKRIEQIKDVLNILINKNILKYNKNEDLNKRAKLHWFITAYWQSFASSTHEINHKTIEEAKEVFFEFLIYPNLTKKGKNLLLSLNI